MQSGRVFNRFSEMSSSCVKGLAVELGFRGGARNRQSWLNRFACVFLNKVVFRDAQVGTVGG